VHRTNIIATSSSSSASHNHESLDVDQEQTPKTQAATLYAGSMSKMHPHRGGPLTIRPIYPEVPGSVEEQPFNASLFSLRNDMLIIF
jgi:hypothetical protein